VKKEKTPHEPKVDVSKSETPPRERAAESEQIITSRAARFPMSSSSDDEPDWLVEQASARKEHATLRAIDSDDDSIAGSDSPKGDGSGGAKGKGKGKDKAGAGPGGTEAKAKSKGRAPPSTRLPLQLAPKVRRDCFLVEARDANLDLSGDFGCIGKLHVRKSGAGAGSSSQGAAGGESEGRVAELRQTLMLDLKGKVYDADIVPCNTLCLVAVDGSKAKVEAVFSDFVQLAAPRDSIFDMQVRPRLRPPSRFPPPRSARLASLSLSRSLSLVSLALSHLSLSLSLSLPRFSCLPPSQIDGRPLAAPAPSPPRSIGTAGGRGRIIR
jgi:hypothetical protein